MYLQVKKNNKVLQRVRIAEEVKIGSSSDCNLRFELENYNSTITNAFNILIINDGDYYSGKFGTYVNGQKIFQSKQLKPGDIISFSPSGDVNIVIKEDKFPTLKTFDKIYSIYPGKYFALIFLFVAAFLLFIIISLLASDNQDTGNQTQEGKVENDNSVVDAKNHTLPDSNIKFTGNLNPNPAESLVTEEVTDEISDNQNSLKNEYGNFLRKISTDNSKPIKYPSEEVMNVIQSMLETDKGNEKLGRIFNLFNADRRKNGLLNEIRKKNLPTSLVVISALVKLESENLISNCEAEANKIRSLSIEYGAADSESALLIVAANLEGKAFVNERVKRSQRSIWSIFTNKENNEKTFNKILKFIALGLIAQNPQKYKIDADPII